MPRKKISVSRTKKPQQERSEHTMQITINNANISGTGGSISNATITGDATLDQPPVDPNAPRPTHPILLPPTSDNPNTFYVLCYCTSPPPAHWEWIAFTPGEDVPERPHPEPHPPEIPTTPGGEKPFPPSGGWGYKEPYGWIYWPGPSGAGPKKR
jgi:hypothetical protein